MRVTLCALLGLSAILFGQTGRAADVSPLPNERLLQQELKQQQIRTTTQRVADQLTAIIDEFDRNGIAGEDVKVLQAIREGTDARWLYFDGVYIKWVLGYDLGGLGAQV